MPRTQTDAAPALSRPGASRRRGTAAYRFALLSDPRDRRAISVRAAIPLALSTENHMRSVLLYLLGIPIPIILLLAFCTHHF
jgi:hypothetical protein